MSSRGGDWLNVYRSLFEHPKTKRLAKRLGVDPSAAAGYLICLWTWAMSVAPDGDLSRFDGEEVEVAAGWGGDEGVFVTAAKDCRWLEDDLTIHDWNDWAGPLVKRRIKECERSAARRSAAKEQDSTTEQPTDDRATTSGRPPVDLRSHAGRPQAQTDRHTDRHTTPPTPPAATEPVDNSDLDAPGPEELGEEQAREEQEQCGLDAQLHNLPCDDGMVCPVRICEPPEELATGPGATLAMRAMAGYICKRCQAASSGPGITMADRQPICTEALVAYADSLLDFDRKKPIRSLPAYLRTRFEHMTEAPVSDELLARLRALEHRRQERPQKREEPRRIRDVLPDIPVKAGAG